MDETNIFDFKEEELESNTEPTNKSIDEDKHTDEKSVAVITPLNEHAKVIQSNTLVEGCYNLKDVEQRLLFAMISQLNPNDEEFKTINLKISDVANYCKLNKKSAYDQIDSACDNLSKQAVILKHKDKNGNRKSQRHPWFDTLNNDEKGILEFKFHRNLTQELIQLKQLKYGFVSMDGQLIGKLESAFAHRFYLLFLQYMNIGHRSFSIAEIIELFMLENKYRDKRTGKLNVSMLLKRVVFPAIERINAITPMIVDIHVDKIGKTITGVSFWFRMKNQPNKDNPDIPEKVEDRTWHERADVFKMCNRLIKEGIDGNEINSILNMFYNADDFMIASEAALESLYRSVGVRNKGGFLRDKIQKYDFDRVKVLKDAEKQEQERIKKAITERNNVIEYAASWQEILAYASKQTDEIKVAEFLRNAVRKRSDLYERFKKEFKRKYGRHKDWNGGYDIEFEIARMRIHGINTLEIPDIVFGIGGEGNNNDSNEDNTSGTDNIE